MLSLLRQKPLLCLLNIKHAWSPQWTPEGDRFELCLLCGKDRGGSPIATHGNWFPGAFG